jgi:hypothetical protein
MMSFNLARKSILCSTTLLALTLPGVCLADAASGKRSDVESQNSGLAAVINKLSDFKSFKLNPLELENLIRIICRQTKAEKTAFNVENEYTCAAGSGVEKISIDWRNGEGAGYVMALSVDYKYDQYYEVRKIMERKLGRASITNNEISLWRYVSDKMLNQLGNPAISTYRDLDTRTARFEIALEQGP